MVPLLIHATTIGDAWFQLLYELMTRYDNKVSGVRRYTVEKGSFKGQDRIEFDHVTVNIMTPWVRPLVPELPPDLGLPPLVDGGDESVEKYVHYLISPLKCDNEFYTYGERISLGWAKVISMYREEGWNTNIPILQVGAPNDLFLSDFDREIGSVTPCLRHIQPRIYRNKLHFVVYFRSWDLWGGFPMNLAGIQMLKEAMLLELGSGLEDGSIVATSPGLHIYDHVEKFAYIRLRRKE